MTTRDTAATACLDWVPKVNGPCVLRSPEGHVLTARVLEVLPTMVRIWHPGLDRPSVWVPRSEVWELT